MISAINILNMIRQEKSFWAAASDDPKVVWYVKGLEFARKVVVKEHSRCKSIPSMSYQAWRPGKIRQSIQFAIRLIYAGSKKQAIRVLTKILVKGQVK